MGIDWKGEFKPWRIKPIHDNHFVFVTSQWQYDKDTVSIIYLVLRYAIFLTFFVVWILTFVLEPPAGKPRWPIYLTNWGLTLCVTQSCLSCVMLTAALIGNNNVVSNLYSTYWVINVMATTVAFTITFIYWSIIYAATGYYWSTMNFMVHGMNSILMFLDFWIVSHPVQILHCVYPFIITLTYTIMTAIFYAAGGTTRDGSRYIYPILKWDQPGPTIGYCIGIAILMVIFHGLTFFMYKLRELIYNCCFPQSESESTDVPVTTMDPSEMRML